MPTESDYRDASRFVDRTFESAEDLITTINVDWSDVVTEGYLKDVIDRTVNATVDNIQAIMDGIRRLYDECARRADICREYDQRISEYNIEKQRYDTEKNGPNPVPKPVLPERPAMWVTPSVRVAS